MTVTQVTSTVPLLRVPGSWPFAVVAALAMLVLAALDFVDAVIAVRWSESGSAVWLAAGIVTSLALFYVYASSLRYADLAVVTIGWIVLLQVALLVWEHARSGAPMPLTKLAAVVAIIALQLYLVVGTPGPTHT